MPKVSICIPTYNQIEYLRKTLDSVLEQTFKDYQIIITDDSPTDIVKDLVDSYNNQNVIKYFKNIKALGSPENWNEAIRKSSGEYIKIMHHDDWFTNEKSLAEFVALLDGHPNVNMAFGATLAVFSSEEQYEQKLSSTQLEVLNNNSLELFNQNLIGAPSTTIFRNKKEIFFDKNLKWLVDIDFYILMLNDGMQTAYSNEILTTTFAAVGRVTDQCKGVKDIEIFEYFYLFNKLKYKNIFKGKNDTTFILKLIEKCSRYKIKNTKEIKGTGYKSKIPFRVSFYLKLNNISKIAGRSYKKLLAKI